MKRHFLIRNDVPIIRMNQYESEFMLGNKQDLTNQKKEKSDHIEQGNIS